MGDITNFPSKPRAPKELNTIEKVIWKRTVEAMPPGWFKPETHDILKNYCRHIAYGNEISALIDEAMGNPETSVSDLDKLGKMHQRESASAVSLATKLRITLQATYDKSKKKPLQTKRAWEL